MHLEPLLVPANNSRMRIPHRMDKRQPLPQIRQRIQRRDHLPLRLRDNRLGHVLRRRRRRRRGVSVGGVVHYLADDVPDFPLELVEHRAEPVRGSVFVGFEELNSFSGGAGFGAEFDEGERDCEGDEDGYGDVDYNVQREGLLEKGWKYWSAGL